MRTHNKLRLARFLTGHSEGFSIIETLVAITILGLLVAFTLTFFNRFYENPVYLLKDEAYRAASLEAENTLANRSYRDTSYIHKNKLKVIKLVRMNDFSYLITIKVIYKNRSTQLSLLNLLVKR